jgi:hypothetical protein
MALKSIENKANSRPWWKSKDADKGVIVPHPDFYKITRTIILPVDTEAVGSTPSSHDPHSGSNPNALHPDEVEHGDTVKGIVTRGTRRTAG